MLSKKIMSQFALLYLVTASVAPAFAGPRDAVAVLNRCGKPLKGDEVIYENTVAGGRRLLTYESGVLHFDRVQNDGWTFKFGTHGKTDNLTPDEMAKYMPCLTDALADSMAAGPIKPLTETQRVMYDAKTEYKRIILWSLGGLVATGLVLAAWPRSEENEA